MKFIKIKISILVAFSLILCVLIAGIILTPNNYSITNEDSLFKENSQTPIKPEHFTNFILSEDECCINNEDNLLKKKSEISMNLESYPNPAHSEDGAFTEGIGTYFEINDSNYLNITLTSNETIYICLESIPRIISFIIKRESSASLTLLNLSGFKTDTTYYRYQDGYLMENFTTCSTGQYEYIQDISQPHHVYIQEDVSTLYINSDYTFTGDIYSDIVIGSDNIMIDGAGYTLQGSGYGYGIYLNGKSGVTIKNINIKGWKFGITITLSSCYNNIYGNTIMDNTDGLQLIHSSNYNSIYENVIEANSRDGIGSWNANYNNIYGNNITSSSVGIFLSTSSNYNISENIVTNSRSGMEFLSSANHNNISGNTIMGGRYGIILRESTKYNYISRNTIMDNDYFGIFLYASSNYNDISENIIFGSNIYGIITEWSSYNSIYENTITNNEFAGIYISHSLNNEVYRNDVTTTNFWGVRLYDSLNNLIYHNNIRDNTVQALDDNAAENYWYHPDLLEGNYWSDYPGEDLDDDGIGDTQLPWPGPYYDYYPLMHPLIFVPIGTNVEIIEPITGVNITFGEIVSSGTISVVKSDKGPSPPSGFKVSGQYYDISTTASYTGLITIGIPYNESEIKGKEENLKLMHYDPALGWIEVQTKVDIDNNIIYGVISQLSVFAVMEAGITATFDLNPDTLNLKSKGKYVTAYIELPDDYDVSTIDINTIMIQESILAEPNPTEIADYDCDDIPDLMVKFDRKSLQSIVSLGESVEIRVSGYLGDGTYFIGICFIRVIDEGEEHFDEEDPSSVV